MATPGTSARGPAALLGAAIAAFGLAGCGTPVRGGVHGAPTDIALLGVVRAPGVELRAGRAALEATAATAFARAGRGRVESAAAVRTEIDAAYLDPILDAYADTGALVPSSLQALMAAPVERRRGVLLRIEENVVERPDPGVETVPGVATVLGGDAGPDVERIVQVARRRVRVAATQVDLDTGAVRPLGTWSTSAESRTVHEGERHDGFVASVAASIADRMAGRPGAPPPPEPPPLQAALDVLFDEIARELPTR